MLQIVKWKVSLRSVGYTELSNEHNMSHIPSAGLTYTYTQTHTSGKELQADDVTLPCKHW